MGGKDFIVVDESANVDEAVAGVIAAAYGFQGQKCSACSRTIIHKNIYDEFVKKLVDGVKQIKVGDPVLNNYMGPVINERAYENILEYIKIGKKEGKLVCGGNPIGDKGYFIEPTVIIDIKQGARIEQEEIFGPVLAVIKAKDFDDALKIANGTVYGLTGALYTKSRKYIERAKRELHCGNLYFNRKCTGAMVGAHPFGGFNLSGTDSKAGGKDYLLLFMQGKAMAEKL
jgi:1-pyrroline-5-carboxylate dehydrogenase